MDFIPLSGSERQELEYILSHIFRPFDRAKAVLIGVDKNIEAIVGGGSGNEVATKLVDWLERNELTYKFLTKGARVVIPNNSRLRDFVEAYEQSRASTPIPEQDRIPRAEQKLLIDAQTQTAFFLGPKGNRDKLLDGIDERVQHAWVRPADPRKDLQMMVEQAAKHSAELKSRLPFERVVHNTIAVLKGRGADAEASILRLKDDLLGGDDEERDAAFSDPFRSLPSDVGPTDNLSDESSVPEALPFGSDDDTRKPLQFMTSGVVVSDSVALLRVRRYINGRKDKMSKGTGWLIAQKLLITNWHVIDARDYRFEKPAELEDYKMQGAHAHTWFDYFTEDDKPKELAAKALLAWDKELDYALLRVETDRPHLVLANKTIPKTGMRLNIAQHSRGNPLTYAIRNNFFVQRVGDDRFWRYLTETESGASGSPVMNDSWEVVALHHQAHRVNKDGRIKHAVTGASPRYHNQGVDIHTILDHLKEGKPEHADGSSPEELHKEIFKAQGWNVQ